MRITRFFPILIAMVPLTVPALLAGSDSAPPLEIRYVETGPVIDGDPADEVWAEAGSIDTFTRVGDSKFTSSMTTVRALYDDEALYLLFACSGKPTEELRASAIRRESPVWETDDDVEFFFMPGKQDTLYIQMAANAIGTEYDIQSTNRDYYKDFVWATAPGWSDDRWFMEMEIPLQQFAISVTSGEEWRANFARNFWSGTDSVLALTWSPLEESLHEREKFNRIRFERDVTFRQSSREIDLAAQEARSIEHLRHLKGNDVYRPILDYLGTVLTHRVMSRNFESMRTTLLDFLRDYPDSSACFDLALRSIHPAATSYRVSPETVESLLREYEKILSLDRTERDLIELDRGIFYNETQQQDQWIQIYRNLKSEDPGVTATAAYLFLSRSKFRPPVSAEENGLIMDALSTYTNLVIRGSVPLYMVEKATWLTASASRDDIYTKYYNVIQRMRRVVPEGIHSFIMSVSAEGNYPAEVETILRKTEYEEYFDRANPHHDLEKADSLIIIINELDREYAQIRLNTLLREKIRQLDQVYTDMGTDSIPAAVKKATELRKHFDGFHPIDMVFALCYETVDSLDRAYDYLENYRKSVGEHWQASGPIARYLDEVKFRRDNRDDPNYFTIPEDRFRVVYKLQGYRKPSYFLDVSSDGRAIIYPNVPDSLDPRRVIDVTTPAKVDSPAVVFRISGEEVDSIRTLLDRFGFLGFRLKNTEKCYRCGNREVTLFTPWNMRTIHLEGDNPDKAPFQFEKSLSAILNRYIRPVFHLETDRKALTRYYSKWDDYHSHAGSPGRQFDDLIELFHSEPVQDSWQNEAWYIRPLMELGEQTGRTDEVEAAIGIRYFDSVFRWKGYAKERLPNPDSREILKSNEYLQRATARSNDARRKEWYNFLSAFTYEYSGDLDKLSERARSLKDEENRGKARALLVWLACARGDFELARALHTELVESKARKEIKSDATIRMMLYSKDNSRNAEAFEYLNQIDRNYRGLLRERRQLPITEISHYSKPDYQIDIAYLAFVSGDIPGAVKRIGAIDEAAIPADRKGDYEDIQRLVKYREIPSSFVQYELPEYLRVFTALSRSGLNDRSTRWGTWLLNYVDDSKTKSQITAMLINTFQKRETWDDLQAETAGRLLDDYRADPGWKSVDLATQIVDAVIEYGNEEDVRSFWKEQIEPYPIQTTRIKSLDKLANYFSETNRFTDYQQVVMKIRTEIAKVENDSPISKLVKIHYALVLADLYATQLNQTERGIALVDSLVGRLPEIGPEAYPYAFGAIADWKANQVGWEALVDFVRPMADSLIEAEKEVKWNIYNPHLIPGRPMDSPLLALRCLVQQGGLRRLNHDFLDLFDLDDESADKTIKGLKISPHRLDLDCDQASLLNWREESFEEILNLYGRQIR